MSEMLAHNKKRGLEWKLSLSTEFPLRYVKQQVAQKYEFLFCVEIPWPLLRSWGEILEDTAISATYIDLLNSTVADGSFMVKRDCERVEKLLYKTAAVVKSTYTKFRPASAVSFVKIGLSMFLTWKTWGTLSQTLTLKFIKLGALYFFNYLQDHRSA